MQSLRIVLILLLFLRTGVQGSARPDNVANAPVTSQPTFDASIPLTSRIVGPPRGVLQRFDGGGNTTPSLHELSATERAKVVDVLQQIPAYSKQALTQHVRSISFVDGMVANGVTVKETNSPLPVFDIVLRASLVSENVSEFLSRKERSCFKATRSGISVSVEAGSLPALLYVLLHESVHVMDITNREGRVGPPQLFKSEIASQLVQGVWSNATTPVRAYRSPLLESSWFRTGKSESIEVAEPTYRALARTPFVSLYGSSNWYDDVAELVSCYYLTQELDQPYRIVLSKGTETLFSLNPTDSELVIRRFGQISALFPN